MTWKTMDSAPYGVEIDILDKYGARFLNCRNNTQFPQYWYSYDRYWDGDKMVHNPLYWMPSPELPDEFKKGK